MRKLLAAIKDRLSSFIAQRDEVAMVLCASETDALPLLSILEGIEADRESDFFWTFTDSFTEPVAYAEAVTQTFEAKHGAVRITMEKEGMKPWPPIPSLVKDASTPPALRLRELAAFSRELLPVPNGGVNVWTFFPLEISNFASYGKLMAEVTEHEFPFPWCHHLRFIIRDDPVSREVEKTFENTPRIQCYKPDLSIEALNQSIEEEAADESLPLAERMSSLLVSAGNDFAFQRYPDALEKYALLLRYHGSMNNTAMAAVAMHGMGQVYERMGDITMADEAYQAALVPASHGEHPAIQVFLNVILSLADLRMKQENWNEAEGYWDSVQQLATVTRDATLKARGLNHRGVCQYQQEKFQEAEQSWRASAIIAAQLQDVEQCGNAVEHMRDLYVMQGNSGSERALNEYLTGLGRAAKG